MSLKVKNKFKLKNHLLSKNYIYESEKNILKIEKKDQIFTK